MTSRRASRSSGLGAATAAHPQPCPFALTDRAPRDTRSPAQRPRRKHGRGGSTAEQPAWRRFTLPLFRSDRRSAERGERSAHARSQRRHASAHTRECSCIAACCSHLIRASLACRPPGLQERADGACVGTGLTPEHSTSRLASVGAVEVHADAYGKSATRHASTYAAQVCAHSKHASIQAASACSSIPPRSFGHVSSIAPTW